MNILKTIEIYYMVYNLYTNKIVFEKGRQGKPRVKMTKEWEKGEGRNCTHHYKQKRWR